MSEQVRFTPRSNPLTLHLPAVTIIKVLVTWLLVVCLIRLWPGILLLLVALLLAVALSPLVRWAENRGMTRGTGVVLVALILALLIALGLGWVLPPLVTQAGVLWDGLPGARANIEQHMGSRYPVFAEVLRQVLELPTSPMITGWMSDPLVWGTLVIQGIAGFAFVLVFTLYLLLDGKRVYAWLLAYVPREHRGKMAETLPEVFEVVHAYIRGQLITSLLTFAFTFVLLTALKVPAALLLAVLAGVCDVIPIAGIIISTVPAVLLALSVSPFAAAVVLGAIIIYSAIESYVIVPHVYGGHLRLSTLAVLVALSVGAALQGIIGAVLVLPLVAAYPIIERIWLSGYLRDEVISDHDSLARAEEDGTHDTAVEAVLRGDDEALESTASKD